MAKARAKKEELPEKSSIEQLLEYANRKGLHMYRASDTDDRIQLRRPTGIASVDFATAGGFVSGTINQIDGQEGVGKDAMINGLLRMNQRIYGPAASSLICYTEPSGYDKMWARKMGVSVALSDAEIERYEQALGAKLGVELKSDLKRQVGSILFHYGMEAQSVLGTILKAAKLNACQLIILNSIDVLLPEDYVLIKAKKEGEADPDTEIEGGSGLDRAAIETEFVNKYTNACLRIKGIDQPTLVIVGQARANLATSVGGSSWGARKWSTKHGSHARRHLKTFNIQLQTIKMLPERETPKVAKVIRWELTKAKCGAHDGQEGEYILYFENGPDIVTDLYTTLRHCGLVLQAGAKTKIVNQEGTVILEDTGANGVMSRLRTDPELWFNTYRMLLDTLPVPPIFKPVEKRGTK